MKYLTLIVIIFLLVPATGNDASIVCPFTAFEVDAFQVPKQTMSVLWIHWSITHITL